MRWENEVITKKDITQPRHWHKKEIYNWNKFQSRLKNANLIRCPAKMRRISAAVNYKSLVQGSITLRVQSRKLRKDIECEQQDEVQETPSRLRTAKHAVCTHYTLLTRTAISTSSRILQASQPASQPACLTEGGDSMIAISRSHWAEATLRTADMLRLISTRI